MIGKYTNLCFVRLLYSSLFFLFLMSSCGDSKVKVLDQQINKALRGDNVIDEDEWNGLKDFILSNAEDFPVFAQNESEINIEELNGRILNMASKRRNNLETPIVYNPVKIIEKKDDVAVNVYIENSASMDGYVSKTTEFEAALSDLLVQIQYRYDSKNLNVNFINTKIHKSEIDEVNSFVEKLEPSKAPYRVGNRSVSKLNEIIEIILDSTSRKNISVFISDCIYSLGKDKDTEGALEFQKSLTKGVFLEKSKEFDFSTMILKMNSKFNGRYYDKEDTPTVLSDVERPYFIWVMGLEEHLEQFSEQIKTKELKGFLNSYYLSSNSSETTPYTTILRKTNLVGRFKPIDRRSKNTNGINDVEFSKGIFQFALAIDLNNIPVDDDYLLTIDNYSLTDGFTIKTIDRIDRNKIDKNDWISLERTSATHIITIYTVADYPLQDLNIKLPIQIPEWIAHSSSIDDAKITEQLDKTFGLKYLLEGVSEAYSIKNDAQQTYLETTITIKR